MLYWVYSMTFERETYMGEDHDNFSNFNDNCLSIINFRLIKWKLVRMWSKKKIYQKEKFSSIEPIGGHIWNSILDKNIFKI